MTIDTELELHEFYMTIVLQLPFFLNVSPIECLEV